MKQILILAVVLAIFPLILMAQSLNFSETSPGVITARCGGSGSNAVSCTEVTTYCSNNGYTGISTDMNRVGRGPVQYTVTCTKGVVIPKENIDTNEGVENPNESEGGDSQKFDFLVISPGVIGVRCDGSGNNAVSCTDVTTYCSNNGYTDISTNVTRAGRMVTCKTE